MFDVADVVDSDVLDTAGMADSEVKLLPKEKVISHLSPFPIISDCYMLQ